MTSAVADPRGRSVSRAGLPNSPAHPARAPGGEIATQLGLELTDVVELGDSVINALLPTMDHIADELGPDGCELVLATFAKINKALAELAADPLRRG